MEPIAFGLTIPRWVFLVTFGTIAVAALFFSLKAYRRYRGRRLVACPEDGSAAAVELDVAHAALTAALAWPELRVATCSHWPEKGNCGQSCLDGIEAAPRECLVSTIVSRWYDGKACVYCGTPFVAGAKRERRPAVFDAGGRRVEWHELPPDNARAALAAHPYVCWNCRTIEATRRRQDSAEKARV
jgi:hypothetical protein